MAVGPGPSEGMFHCLPEEATHIYTAKITVRAPKSAPVDYLQKTSYNVFKIKLIQTLVYGILYTRKKHPQQEHSYLNNICTFRLKID